jgi:glucokinase
MNTLLRQALVADIGGTFICLAIADIDELTISHFALLNAADFSSPMDAVERYLRSVPARPDKASFAIAGSVGGDIATMTFKPWTISKGDVQTVTGAETVALVNDVEGLALSLPHLTSDELVPMLGGRPQPSATKVVINASTGLGVAALISSPGGAATVLHGEGGQVAFPATRADEFNLRSGVPSERFLSAETVFSGAGLVSIYVGLALAHQGRATPLTAPQITQAAIKGDDRNAVEAVRLMGLWFARFAGDVALMFGARGGVYLSGGLSANIVPRMGQAAFLTAFADKARARGYLESIPVNVIKTGADAGLRGAAVALARELDAMPIPARPRLAVG